MSAGIYGRDVSGRWCVAICGESRARLLGPLASKAMDGELFVTGPGLPRRSPELPPPVAEVPFDPDLSLIGYMEVGRPKPRRWWAPWRRSA